MKMINLEKYVGIEYRANACGFDGCDCIGLLSLIYREEFSIALPQYLYGHSEDRHQVSDCVEKQRSSWQRVKTPRFADLVLLQISGWPVHVGFYINDGKMIHCLKGHHAAIEQINGFKWKNRVDGYYRWEKSISGEN